VTGFFCKTGSIPNVKTPYWIGNRFSDVSIPTKNGFETKTASDGAVGFETARTFKPDIITLDIIMERETGLKFYRNVVSNPELKDGPVIIVSGVCSYKKLFERDHATIRGPFGFLEKPIEPKELLALIDKAVRPTPSH